MSLIIGEKINVFRADREPSHAARTSVNRGRHSPDPSGSRSRFFRRAAGRRTHADSADLPRSSCCHGTSCPTSDRRACRLRPSPANSDENPSRSSDHKATSAAARGPDSSRQRARAPKDRSRPVSRRFPRRSAPHAEWNHSAPSNIQELRSSGPPPCTSAQLARRQRLESASCL